MPKNVRPSYEKPVSDPLKEFLQRLHIEPTFELVVPKEYEPMPNDTPPGTNVRFMGKGGYPYDRGYAFSRLIVGRLYKVRRVKMGKSSSRVALEYPKGWFNTVMFTIADDTSRSSGEDVR